MIKIKKKDMLFEIEESIVIIIFACIFSGIIKKYFENYFMCFLFVLFHELAHIVVASIYGVKVKSIKVKMCGMNARLGRLDISKYKKIFIFLAGPIANFILAYVFKNIKFVFEINISLGLINLVPIFPLDGFNVLKVLINNKNKHENKPIKIVENIFKIVILICSFILILKYKNYSLFILIIYIIFANLNVEKYRI